MYVFQRGFMDGLTGFRFCMLIASHEFFTYLKVLELHHLTAAGPRAQSSTANAQIMTAAQLLPPVSRQYQDRNPLPHPSTPATASPKIKQFAWNIVRCTVFRWSFQNWNGLRVEILRFFGATIGDDVRIHPSAHIELPWTVKISSGARIGPGVILPPDSVIEANSIINQRAPQLLPP